IKYTGGDMAKFREGFKEQGEKQVKIRLALEAVVNAENITVSEEDMDKEIARIAEAYKMEADKVRELVPVEEVKKDLAVNKAIDFVKENATITDKVEKADK
ncbi:MAG: trigger factor, partial [Oscillospiraceae bacterium]